MAKIYVIASIMGQGKTTTSILLKKYFESQGLKVANLQRDKGRADVGLYLKNDCHHYTIPVEAVKDIEKWLPIGYDVYILEVGFIYRSPISALLIDLFRNINLLTSYEFKDAWKKHVSNRNLKLLFWDTVHNRNVRQIITKSPTQIDKEPYVDTNLVLHNADKFVFDEVTPRMTLPKSDKEAIAVGAFPAEFMRIFNLKWYGYDYQAFIKRYKEENYDIAVIGACSNEELRFSYKPSKPKVFCYQATTYLGELYRYNPEGDFPVKPSYTKDFPIKTNLQEMCLKIKNNPVSTWLGEEGCLYECLNNKFWVFREYIGLDTITAQDNMIICNGWVLPQYLIQEGYLEV